MSSRPPRWGRAIDSRVLEKIKDLAPVSVWEQLGNQVQVQVHDHVTAGIPGHVTGLVYINIAEQVAAQIAHRAWPRTGRESR